MARPHNDIETLNELFALAFPKSALEIKSAIQGGKYAGDELNQKGYDFTNSFVPVRSLTLLPCRHDQIHAGAPLRADGINPRLFGRRREEDREEGTCQPEQACCAAAVCARKDSGVMMARCRMRRVLRSSQWYMRSSGLPHSASSVARVMAHVSSLSSMHSPRVLVQPRSSYDQLFYPSTFDFL